MSQPSFEFPDDDALVDDGGVPTFTVGELAEAINASLRRSFIDGVWVRGEIQGWSVRGQHAYFRLVDDDGQGGRAVVDVQFFANARARVRPMLAKYRLELGDGMKVRIFGHLDFYAPGGRLGLKMSSIDSRYTLGEMMLERQDVVRRLVASGLYDANRGLRLAVPPLRVGVVTSTEGAAWADFHHELSASRWSFQLRVVDVRVQGEQAAAMVAAAVTHLGRADDLDVIVVIRGGGSRTELAVFDHESVATAIGRSQVPVFTGLGHQIDSTIADEVAHRSLKTPTACAAALVELVDDASARAELAYAGIARRATSALDRADARLSLAAHEVGRRTTAAVDRAHHRLAARAARVRVAGGSVLDRQQQRLGRAIDVVTRAPRRLDQHDARLDVAATRARLLDPAITLARGWSITRTADGQVVRAAAALQTGDLLITEFADGSATSRVEDTSP